MHVRNTSLISVASPGLRAHKLPQNTTVHGQLAAFLALKYQESEWDHRAWQEVWPTQEEFAEILPILWSSATRDLLPHAAKGENISLLGLEQKNSVS